MLVALMPLAACAGSVPVENVVTVSGAQFDSVRGEADLVVRTFLPAEENTRREVTGAVCELDTILYSTRFTTPARLKLPNFGPQSPELSISCRAEDWSGRAEVPVETDWAYPPGGYAGYGYGPPGYYYGGPWGGWGWPAGAVPVSGYPDVHVMLR